jgi:hypothetical protein
LFNNENFEKIKSNCSGNITSVLNRFKLGEKIWFLVPSSCQVNFDNKWNDLNKKMPFLFQEKEDHYRTIDTSEDHNFIFLGEKRNRAKNSKICSFVFLFMTLPLSSSFWNSDYVKHFINYMTTNESFILDFIQPSLTVEKNKKIRDRVFKDLKYFDDRNLMSNK